MVEFEPVAFTAWAPSATYVDRDTIIFSGEVTNVGNHYNPETGIFTCPIYGMYVFQSSLSAFNSVIGAHITHDGIYLTTTIGDNEGGSDNIQGSNMAVFPCDQGDQVWLEVDFGADEQLTGDYTRRYSTFSGFLLYPM